MEKSLDLKRRQTTEKFFVFRDNNLDPWVRGSVYVASYIFLSFQ